MDAPAGFGKTTLVAQWRLSPAESRPFAWVSLDSGDNDPGRLWWHVVSALDRACPEFDAGPILALSRSRRLISRERSFRFWSTSWPRCRSRWSWCWTTVT